MAKFATTDRIEDAYTGDNWRPLLPDRITRRDSKPKVYMLGAASIKEKLQGVVLPSMDYDYDTEDSAFAKSVLPCWSNRTEKKDEREFVPTQWWVALNCYPFLGSKKEHWVSPGNRGRGLAPKADFSEDERADAFDDLYRFIRYNREMDQAAKDFYLKSKDYKTDPLVPGRTMRVFSLCECRTQEEPWHLALVGYTVGAYNYILEQARWRHEDAGPPRDPKFPRYMLGDFTDPAGALVWRADKFKIAPNDTTETNVLAFTERRKFLDSDQKTRSISEATLRERWALLDPANWNIPTYQEMVDHMVEDYPPEVMTEMLRAACGHRADVPERAPRGRMISTPTGGHRGLADEEDDIPGVDPVAAALGGSRFAPPVAASDEAEKTWLCGPTGTKPRMLTAEQIQAAYDKGTPGLKVRLESGWTSVEQSGLLRKPDLQDDIVPDDGDDLVPDDGFVPADDRGPAAAPATSGGSFAEPPATVEDVIRKLIPGRNLADIEPEQQQQLRALAQEALEQTKGKEFKLPADLAVRLVTLAQSLS
jgi:hypothetical protein